MISGGNSNGVVDWGRQNRAGSTLSSADRLALLAPDLY